MSTTPSTQLASLAGTTWQLDPASSKAEFRVPHFWGLSSVTGTFGTVGGTMSVDAGGQARMELTIDAASVDTRNKNRDKDLRESFFKVEANPHVRFVSSEVSEAADGTLHVVGTLEAGGASARVEMDPTLKVSGDQIEITAQTAIDHKAELGMTRSPMGMIKTPATLTVQATLRRADA
jgi:polyisoprenoid-binding protein YceI